MLGMSITITSSFSKHSKSLIHNLENISDNIQLSTVNPEFQQAIIELRKSLIEVNEKLDGKFDMRVERQAVEIDEEKLHETLERYRNFVNTHQVRVDPNLESLEQHMDPDNDEESIDIEEVNETLNQLDQELAERKEVDDGETQEINT